MRFASLCLVLALFAVLAAPVALAVGPANSLVGGSNPADRATPDPTLQPPLAAFDADAAPAANAAVTNHSNRTRILAVPEPAVEVTTIRTATLDLGPATTFSGNVSAVRMETAAVEASIRNAADDEARIDLIRRALGEVERETAALRERRQAAIEAYNAERISTQAFVVELATVGAKAAALEARVSSLQRFAGETEGWSDARRANVRSRAESVRYQLRALGGPVSDRAIAAIRGTAPATRLFVTTGPQGYELSTIVDDTYVRQAYRGAVRAINASASLNASDASRVVRESYPTLVGNESPGAIGSGSTYVVTAPHDGGNLTAFVDSQSKRVFKEYQYLSLPAYDSGSTATNVVSGLRLTVNRSYPGGPLRVNVTDAETGEPVNATVTLSPLGEETSVVGRTGDDGVLWTLSPRGRFAVAAIRDGTYVNQMQTNATEAPALE